MIECIKIIWEANELRHRPRHGVTSQDQQNRFSRSIYPAAFAAARPAFLPENKQPPRNVPSSER